MSLILPKIAYRKETV